MQGPGGTSYHTSMAAVYWKQDSSSSGARYHRVTTYSVMKLRSELCSQNHESVTAVMWPHQQCMACVVCTQGRHANPANNTVPLLLIRHANWRRAQTI